MKFMPAPRNILPFRTNFHNLRNTLNTSRFYSGKNKNEKPDIESFLEGIKIRQMTGTTKSLIDGSDSQKLAEQKLSRFKTIEKILKNQTNSPTSKYEQSMKRQEESDGATNQLPKTRRNKAFSKIASTLRNWKSVVASPGYEYDDMDDDSVMAPVIPQGGPPGTPPIGSPGQLQMGNQGVPPLGPMSGPPDMQNPLLNQQIGYETLSNEDDSDGFPRSATAPYPGWPSRSKFPNQQLSTLGVGRMRRLVRGSPPFPGWTAAAKTKNVHPGISMNIPKPAPSYNNGINYSPERLGQAREVAGVLQPGHPPFPNPYPNTNMAPQMYGYQLPFM